MYGKYKSVENVLNYIEKAKALNADNIALVEKIHKHKTVYVLIVKYELFKAHSGKLSLKEYCNPDFEAEDISNIEDYLTVKEKYIAMCCIVDSKLTYNNAYDVYSIHDILGSGKSIKHTYFEEYARCIVGLITHRTLDNIVYIN